MRRGSDDDVARFRPSRLPRRRCGGVCLAAARAGAVERSRAVCRGGLQLFIVAWGGAIPRIGADHSPVAGREARFIVHPLLLWEDPADDERNRALARGFRDDMRRWSTGATYPNFLGDEGAARMSAAFGASAQRLARRHQGPVGPARPLPHPSDDPRGRHGPISARSPRLPARAPSRRSRCAPHRARARRRPATCSRQPPTCSVCTGSIAEPSLIPDPSPRSSRCPASFSPRP